MPIEFWEIIVLMVILAIGSIIFGFFLGYDKRQKELTKEIINEYRQKYEKQLIEAYNRSVEKRATEIVAECFDVKYEEIRQEIIEEMKRDNKNESIGSN